MFFDNMVLQNECLCTILGKAPLYLKHRDRLWQHRFAAVLAFCKVSADFSVIPCELFNFYSMVLGLGSYLRCLITGAHDLVYIK